MKIFFQNKEESISFCETVIPDKSIDSDIYVLSNYLFFKSRDDMVVMKNNILLYLDDYHHSLTKILYNDTLKMVAVMDSKSKLQLLLEINDSKMKIKSIQFSELIISEDFANPYEYSYSYTDKLEILHKGNNYIFESFDYSNSDTENNKAIEVKMPDKLDANISLLFNLSTEFGYSIVCKKQDNVLYLIDDKKQIINSHKNHDFVIKKYSFNRKRNLLATISIQNNFYVWNILKEGLKLWTNGEVSSKLFLQDMAFSENGKFIGILTKTNENSNLSKLEIIEIIKKKNNHKLKLINANETVASTVKISNFGSEIKDNETQIHRIKGDSCTAEVIPDNSLDKKSDRVIELAKPDKLDNDKILLFKLSTKFDYYITCQKQDNILYLLDNNNYIIDNHTDHDCFIKSYTINQKHNLLATISVQNKLRIWKISKERLKLLIAKNFYPRTIFEHMAFTTNGEFIKVITKRNESDKLSKLDFFQIINKQNEPKLKLHRTQKVDSNRKIILNDKTSISDNKLEMSKPDSRDGLRSETKKNSQLLNEKEIKQTLDKSTKENTSEQEAGDINFNFFPKITINENTIFRYNYELPQEQQERESVEVFMGVDIGTKYSKVMIEIASSKQKYIFPFKSERGELFHPTEVYIANDIIHFDKNEVKNKEYETIDYLKLRFQNDQIACMIFITYIVHIINTAKLYAHNYVKATELRFYNLDFFIAISFPESLVGNSNEQDFNYFKKVVATVELLTENTVKTEYTLAQISREFTNSKYCIENNTIAVVAESISEIFSFLEVINDYGQIILIDIGEGTTELSGCWVDESKNKKISVWHSKVIYEGVYNYNNINSSDYKEVLKAQLEALMESEKAHYEGTGFSNPNTIYVGGGGCKINDIVSNLEIIKANNKTINLTIENLSELKSSNTRHSFSDDVLKNYHRFLVSIGSIEFLKYEDEYEVVPYKENLTNIQLKKEKRKSRRPKTRQEINEEIMRRNELW